MEKSIILLLALGQFHFRSDGAVPATSPRQNFTLPDFCPLGEPLRSRVGDVIKCNCPPHPFCPRLYYCKIAQHGEAGVCCPDFGADRRHEVKPEDSRLPTSAVPPSDADCRRAPGGGSCGGGPKPPTSPPEDDGDAVPGPLQKITEQQAVNSPAIPYKPAPRKVNRTTIRIIKLKAAKDCKLIGLSEIPPLPSSVCKYADPEMDEEGCPTPPKVLCPDLRNCPEITVPIVPPHCTLGEEKFNADGCPMPQSLICRSSPGSLPKPNLVPRSPGTKPKTIELPPRIQPSSPGFGSQMKGKKRPQLVPRKPIVPTTQSPSPPPCPIYPLPPTLSPDCVVATPSKDDRGCYLPPEIVCEKLPTPYAELIEEKVPEAVSHEKISSTSNGNKPKKPTKCPQVLVPVVQPGCKLLDPKYDNRGCMLMPEITCDASIISKNTLQCPLIQLPKMDPLCSFGPNRNDSNGCPMVPEIMCPTTIDYLTTDTTPESVTVRETKEPKIMSHCPYIPPPYLPPGCSYGVAKYDERGCSLTPDVVCKSSDFDENNRIQEQRPGEGRDRSPRRDFRDMLTAEFYHMVQSNVAPDAGTFRRTRAIPVVTAGRFRGCLHHSDCFHFREPREWCDTAGPGSEAVWTDKSCHCAEDTLVPGCIVERSNRGLLEWTFCADYSQCAINK